MNKQELITRRLAEQNAEWDEIFAKMKPVWDEFHTKQRIAWDKVIALPDDYEGEMPS